jgi:hypothetical protein
MQVADQPAKYDHSTSILSVAGLQNPGSPSLAPSAQVAHQSTKHVHSTSFLSVAGLQKPGSPSLAPSTQVAHQSTIHDHSTSILSVAGLQKPGSPSLAPSAQVAHQSTKHGHSTSILSVAGLQKPGSPSLAPSTQVAHQPTKHFKQKHVEVKSMHWLCKLSQFLQTGTFTSVKIHNTIFLFSCFTQIANNSFHNRNTIGQRCSCLAHCFRSFEPPTTRMGGTLVVLTEWLMQLIRRVLNDS